MIATNNLKLHKIHMR